MMRTTLTALALIAATQSTATAQSLFATRGLGVPIAAVDARARALGGIGVGLFGLNNSLVNPAEMAGIGRRGVAAALQPVSGTTRFDGAEDSFSGSRFPLVRMTYPLSQRFALGAGYGAFLDQSWGIVREGTEPIGGRDVRVEDLIQSTGGIAHGSVGLAFVITPRIAVGAAGGVYTGSLDRRVARSFPEDEDTLQPFDERVRWDFLGPFGTFGVRYDPDPALRIGASVTASGDLRARGVIGEANDARFNLPLRMNVGASGWLSPLLLASLGVERGGAPSDFVQLPQNGGIGEQPGSEVRSTWRIGGGLEYEGMRRGQRIYPVRLGGQWAELPFAGSGETTPTEWSVSAGLGFRLAGDQASPLAVVDAAIERGGRSGLVSDAFADGLSESFWRFTVSLALFGR
jgi:hypothetical protein